MESFEAEFNFISTSDKIVNIKAACFVRSTLRDILYKSKPCILSRIYLLKDDHGKYTVFVNMP